MWQPTHAQTQEIVAQYLNGASTVTLAEGLGLSRETIAALLRRNGVEIRGRSEAILAVGARRRRWRYEPQQEGIS
jgi:DNA-binding CsgD family transcriptional regulator